MIFIYCIVRIPEWFNKYKKNKYMTVELKNKKADATELATFGAGCFWCVEAIYKDLRGVTSVVSGYSGGKSVNPGYKEVSTGNTGHAEVCQLSFDPAIISYAGLLEVFWAIHDPTSLNRQGGDIGTQYRSVIFYHNEEQRKIAESSMKQAAGDFSRPILTEIAALKTFYEAEDYHQDYYSNNPSQPYCSVVVGPKLKKIREKYKDLLK